jgi:predicted nuclease of predicted toxin-antitoxin system
MKNLTDNDAHALACFFALHHAALALKASNIGPRNIERVVMATFGLVEKKGPYRLTARGRRARALAST